MAQRLPDIPADRLFVVRQESYWLPHGWDSTRVSAADTILVISRRTRRDRTQQAIGLSGGDGFPGRHGASVTSLGHSTWRLVLDLDEAGNTFGYSDPRDERELGSLLLDVPRWTGQARDPAKGHELTLLVGIDRDTLRASRRLVRVTRARDAAGPRRERVEAQWQVRYSGDNRIDEHLEPQGVVVRVDLRGELAERYIADSTGRRDSVTETGTLTGTLIYLHASGATDTTIGSWFVSRRGWWMADWTGDAGRRFNYFAQHGRDAPGEEPARPQLAIHEAAQRPPRASAALQRAYALALSPFDRLELDAELRWAARDSGTVLDELVQRCEPARLVQVWLNVNEYASAAPVNRRTAACVARVLTQRQLQRELAVDRESAFASLLGLLASGRRIDSAAAGELIAMARGATDPRGRDIVLLMAYVADPAEARSPIDSLADCCEGYGPITRAYTNGSIRMMGASWGVRRGDMYSRDQEHGFPGPQASADAHRAWRRSQLGSGRFEPAVAAWFRARGLDAATELRHRFRTDASATNRVVWSEYLVMFRDTSSLAWLRDTATTITATRAEAYRQLGLFPALTGDSTIISELQNLVLEYALDNAVIQDTAGTPVRPFSAHDERPGAWYVISDSLAPDVLARWSSRVRPISTEGLTRLAADSGLQMALRVSPVMRVVNRYTVTVALLPFGQPCLCGGGTEFVFERRGGRWIAVSTMSWIS